MLKETSDKKNIVSKLEEDSPSSKKTKSLYDIINSEELELLYKKNAHLLARLSRTGRENTQLYTKLSSLAKEKSNLGNRNLILNSKLKGLKEQISRFAHQHREFNSQSRKLKEELEKVQKLETVSDDGKKQTESHKSEEQNNSSLDKQINLFEKKEQVYKKQIENLQYLCQKAQEKKNDETVKKLAKELERVNQESEFAFQEKQKLERERDQLKNLLKEKSQALSDSESNLEALQKKQSLQDELSESQKVKSYENKIVELKKQKEQLKSGFVQQIECFTTERDTLKFQCENLKKALSVSKLGFDQAMISFQRKYVELYKNNKQREQELKEKAEHLNSLTKEAHQFDQRILQAKEAGKNEIKMQKEQEFKELSGELEALKDYNKDLEKEIHTLRTKAEDLFLKEKKVLSEEIKNLKWNQDKNILRMQESHTKEIENLKFDYEQRIDNLSLGFKSRLSHVRVEMENDLCSERKRYEVFKEMKMKQMAEIKESLSLLQTESQELRNKKFILEKSLEETKRAMEGHLKTSEKLKKQNESLKDLWQDLQKQNESKDQQIRSLQKLNKSLSLSLNQIYPKEKKQVFTDQEKDIKSDDASSKEKDFKPHVLANLHFD